MDAKKYLDRIGIEDARPAPTAETLRLLQREHLLRVPFENLDIHWGRKIVLDTASFYRKIVGHRRGGFCYELNGLFNELLLNLGFGTRLVSARVFMASGDFSPEYSHAAILVTTGEEEYLADVGFGAFTAGPLRFVCDVEQEDETGIFTIRRSEDRYFEVAKKEDGGWVSEYIFKPLGRHLPEFTEMCDFQQTSPKSHFTQGKVCSIMTPGGRKTLTDKAFIVTNGGAKTENEVGSEEEFDEILGREFGIKKVWKVWEVEEVWEG